MEKEKHVDWDGLVYYDGKIKDHIDNKLSELDDKIDHESSCLHGQVSDVETRVTIHDQDIRALSKKIDDVDVVVLKQEITNNVVERFDDTIESTVTTKVEEVLDGDEFTTIVVEKIEEIVGTTDQISYGSF